MIHNLHTLEVAKTFRVYTGTAGAYVSVSPIDIYVKVLGKWAEELGFPFDAKRLDSLHCTVVWSKQTVNNTSVDSSFHHVAKLNRFEYWDGHDNDGYLVAIFDSPSLVHLNKKWVNRGAAHSFSDYTPHLTLKDKFVPDQELFDKISSLSKKYKGTLISFNNECLESAKS